MEKRVIIRVIFESLSLKDAAELEEKIEKLLKDSGPYDIEITSLSTRVPPPVE